MKDRFKFRGKCENTGKWIYGCLVCRFYKATNPDKEPLFIDTLIGDKSSYRVRPETVGQCTGRKDSKGTLIFEEEIVENDFGEGVVCRYIVEWADEEIWPFSGLCVPVIGGGTTSSFRPNECKVIGNIHDNPELLEEAT